MKTIIFETGAKSHAVNDLILFADNTRELAEIRDQLYTKVVQHPDLKQELHLIFSFLLSETIKQYRMEFKDLTLFVNLTKEENDEFCALYADDFENWKSEHGLT